MRKLLLNCDQVFDVLTRGPFPSGEPTDESVEHHLRACHECRQLAEALRPAVAVLHEAVSAEQAIDLPEYQGSLPFDRPKRPLSVVRLAGPPRGDRAVRQCLAAPRPAKQWGVNSVRLVAAILLVVGLGTWLWALVTDSRHASEPISREPYVNKETWSSPRDGVPAVGGLMTLANLRLPSTCVPLTHRPLSHNQAKTLALALNDGSLAGLQCCTECHHAGQSVAKVAPSTEIVRTAQRHCQACHRG